MSVLDEKIPASEERQPEEVQTQETPTVPETDKPEEIVPEETTEPTVEELKESNAFHQKRFQETNERLKESEAESAKTIADLKAQINTTEEPTGEEEPEDITSPEFRRQLAREVAGMLQNDQKLYRAEQEAMDKAYRHYIGYTKSEGISVADADAAITEVSKELPKGTSPASICRFALKELQLNKKMTVKETITTKIAEDTAKKKADLAGVVAPQPGAATSPEKPTPLTDEQRLDQKFQKQAKNANDALFD